MVFDESSRHALYTRLEQVLGEDEARVLMEHLPPSGWADVATKHDLSELEARLELRFEAALQRGLNQQTRTFVTWLIAAMAGSSVTVGGIAIGAARLT